MAHRRRQASRCADVMYLSRWSYVHHLHLGRETLLIVFSTTPYPRVLESVRFIKSSVGKGEIKVYLKLKQKAIYANAASR